MSKVVTIPKDRNPFVVIVNGVKYSYPAGATTEVPDEVADVIEKYVGAKPKPDPNAGGGVSWNDLRDKPFYEETKTVNEPLNITWDGNTDGLMWLDLGYFRLCKVSNAFLNRKQITSLTVSLNTGKVFNADSYEENGDTATWGVSTPSYMVGVVFVDKENSLYVDSDNNTVTISEKGIYILATQSGPFITSITSIEPIEQTKTVVTPIETKYLPKSLHFGDETTMVKGDTLYWDGNTDGLASPIDRVYKVSEIPGTLTISADTECIVSGFDETVSIYPVEYVEGYWEIGDYIIVMYEEAFNDPEITAGYGGVEPGIYFVKTEEGYPESLTIPGFGDFVSKQTVVKPIDPKYLPDVSDIDPKWIEALAMALGIGGNT